MKGKNIIIVILLLVIVGLVGYICYNSGLFSKDKPEEEKPVVEEKTMSEEDALSLLERFNINTGTVESYNDSSKMFAVINELDNVKCGENTKCEKFKKKTCKELLDGEMNKWKFMVDGYYYNVDEDSVPYYCHDEDGATFYPFDAVNKKNKEMYGKDLEKKSIYPYYYIEKLNGFANLLYGDGTSGPTVNVEKIKSASIKDDLLTITVYLENIALSDSDEIGKNFYKESYDFTDKELENITKEIEEKYLDKVNCYNVLFDVDGDNYIFNEIKEV